MSAAATPSIERRTSSKVDKAAVYVLASLCALPSVILEYRYSSDNNGWNDWTQYGEELTQGPYNWTFNAIEGTGYYEFKLVLSDNQGWSVESQVESVNITQFPTALLILVITLVIILAIVTILIMKKMKNKK